MTIKLNLFTLFIVLLLIKGLFYPALSWYIVTAPLWIPFSILCLFGLLVLVSIIIKLMSLKL